MIYPTQIPGWFTKIFPGIIWRGDAEGKKVFLTFDDGPIPEVTPWVLDILGQYNQKATFFCVGENVQKHQLIFNRIIEEGHSVGNHTFHHVDGWKKSVKEYQDEIEKTDKFVEGSLFRPPFGRMTPQQYNLLKKSRGVVYWTFLSGDFDPDFHVGKCLDEVEKLASDGCILVFHDSLKAQKNLRIILPMVLEFFQKDGIQSLALPQKST
ncbi:MAG: polysaccharide deacetylase family protein [Saprospiraceae bacterium]|nr:polysaccharide deacetylase family protein [Saprospiraceae bacterium]MBK6565015.1 polysaccharide deacetylase family protein [Saprospiraceae bacterium]MBK7523651.1 polysaccharide deacetylase family protein [Saprospiraceae bacterium]MBK8079764.1 polysaccharide deacetylase family protein [Saprospiraceae bacterium]MBK8371356.1 polysaccharide deacetylase family protein [Saprospiraceae bacterium]